MSLIAQYHTTFTLKVIFRYVQLYYNWIGSVLTNERYTRNFQTVFSTHEQKSVVFQISAFCINILF